MRLLAFGSSGSRLSTLGDSRKVVLWDTAKRTVAQTLDGAPERPLALTFDRGRRMLAAAGTADTVTLWDLQSRVPRSVSFPAKSGIRHLTFGPDGHYLVVAATGGVLIRDVASGNLLRTLSCKPGAPTWVSLNPAENRLAAVGNTGTVWIWNWRTKGLPSEEADLKLSIGPSGGLIRQVLWSLDGRHLLTVNGNSTLYVLRLPDETAAD
jgi:WD40 repeat protein